MTKLTPKRTTYKDNYKTSILPTKNENKPYRNAISISTRFAFLS